MKFPNDADGDVLRSLFKKGVDLSLPRNIDFYCYASDMRVATEIAAKTVLLGLNPRIYDDKADLDPTKRFSVYSSITMIPTYEAIMEMQEKLDKLLVNYDTRCDGWGTLSD